MLEIIGYEIACYEVELVDKKEKHIFYTDEKLLEFINRHENEHFRARRIEYAIFREKE